MILCIRQPIHTYWKNKFSGQDVNMERENTPAVKLSLNAGQFLIANLPSIVTHATYSLGHSRYRYMYVFG